MAALKLKKNRFRVSGALLARATFDEWIANEGRLVLEEEFGKIPLRWAFGRRRVRRRLLRDARRVLRPKSAFAGALERRLDRLPLVIRSAGIMIQRAGHRDLVSIDATKALVVIPRAIAQNEFTLFLQDELSRRSDVARFRGLARRVLRDAAAEAEELFFDYLGKGRQYLDSTGKGLILGIDSEFGWRLNRVDGHYYYGYAAREAEDLNQRKALKKFKSEMEEILCGQEVHLKRLRSDEVVAIADAFRAR